MSADRVFDAPKGLAATIIDWGLVLMTIGLAALALAAFLTPTYDWDVDHEIYFAQRLLQGEWLWMREFHDKLPAIQLVFLVPAWLSSVTVWRLMSLTAVLGAALVMTRLLPQFIGLDRLGSLARRRILWFGGLVWTAWMFGSAGGITVVNPMVASLQLISLLLILHLAVHPEIRGIRWLALALVAGLAGALAISVRPYVVGQSVLVVLLGVAWRGGWVRGGSPAPSSLPRTILDGLAWTLIFLFWGSVLNVLPYALSGQMALFREGMAMLAGELNPNSAVRGFIDSLRRSDTLGFFVTFALLILATLASLPRLDTRVRMVALVLICGTASTLAMFLTKHYWPHYNSLLVGAHVVLALVLLAHAAQSGSRLSTAIALGISALVAIPPFALAGARAALLLSPADTETAAIVAFMSTGQAGGHDFLAVSDMKSHWLLQQSRHGFPHAANTKHIHNGWWGKAPEVTQIFAPRTGEAYCARLLSAGPEYVFDRRDGFVVDCLTSAASPYSLDSTLVGTEIVAFRR